MGTPPRRMPRPYGSTPAERLRVIADRLHTKGLMQTAEDLRAIADEIDVVVLDEGMPVSPPPATFETRLRRAWHRWWAKHEIDQEEPVRSGGRIMEGALSPARTPARPPARTSLTPLSDTTAELHVEGRPLDAGPSMAERFVLWYRRRSRR